MKVLFEYDVDFMRFPLLPPTIANCEKCAFYRPECIRSDTRVCNMGQNGYFAKNYMRELAGKEAVK
jgi:hypothetical protein